MSTRAQKIRLGVFMILAILLFLGFVGTLAGIKFFNPRDLYYVRYTESVSGLEVGSTVKMKGVRVGQVEKINIGDDVESVEVTLALKPKTPIKQNTKAIMTAIGITGLQFIELTGGTQASKKIAPNTPKSYIKAGSSMMSTLTGKAEVLAIKMEAAVNRVLKITDEENRNRLRSLLKNTDTMVLTGTALIQENREQVKRVFSNLDRTTRSLNRSARTINKLVKNNSGRVETALTAAASAARTMDRSLQGLRPKATLKAINGAANSFKRRVDDPKITRLVVTLNRTATEMTQLTAQMAKVIRHRDRQIGGIMFNLDRAADYLKKFSRSIKERPSLLLGGRTVKEKRIP